MPHSEDASPVKRKKQGLLAMFGFNREDEAQRSEDDERTAEEEDATSALIQHARAFQDLRVYDVMTPRVDVVAVELSTPLIDLVRTVVESEHSRLPIYRESLDDPIGVVHIKDILKIFCPDEDDIKGEASGPKWSEPVLHRLRREVIYVPTSMKASELLLQMQGQRIHMALVIDEFGGTDGLVTLEDLLEAVVGDIDDEYDEVVETIVKQADDLYEVDGRVELSAVEEALGISLQIEDSEEEIDTIAGLAATLAGRVPRRGEVVPYEAAGIDLEVLDADARRIKRLRVHRLRRLEDVFDDKT
jgi:CBS domain containing-hemolysin-like protein